MCWSSFCSLGSASSPVPGLGPGWAQSESSWTKEDGNKPFWSGFSSKYPSCREERLLENFTEHLSSVGPIRTAPSSSNAASTNQRRGDTYPPVAVLLTHHHQHLTLREAQLIMVVRLAVVQRLSPPAGGSTGPLHTNSSAFDHSGSRSSALFTEMEPILTQPSPSWSL